MQHIITSQFDVSCHMALQLSECLLELKSFDESNIMSRHLYLYHTKKYELGETMKFIYENLKDKIQNYHEHLSVCREDFLFDQLTIDETVKLTDNKTWWLYSILTHSLHTDLSDIYYRYSRWSTPSKNIHPAYAPTVLHEALHYMTTSNNIAEVIEKAKVNRNVYCLPIIGVLSEALWSIPLDLYKYKAIDVQLKIICDTTNELSKQWISQYENANA
ncbi:unnamed protein product [Rotaria sp. Silwood1]|nr:unnamed protein product [Rotaria sp. Silwood1]CAF3438007.1 unnamed protein product [Rotaria sp. Silwood1]CAF4899270.1 unnamed protein product [Rotaria sp. Silwood1]